MNTFQLKLLAVILMIIDHIGFFLLPQYRILRIIGRLSFPLFAFLIVKGFRYTKDVNKYFLRLFIFANIIQIPSFFMTIPVNIFYTLSFGLLAIIIYESAYSMGNKIIGLLCVVFLTSFVQPDYSVYGVVLIFIIHLLMNHQTILFLAMGLLSILYYGLFDIQLYSVLAVPLMMMYNEKQGPRMKYLFYLFYPTHIVLLEWISQKI